MSKIDRALEWSLLSFSILIRKKKLATKIFFTKKFPKKFFITIKSFSSEILSENFQTFFIKRQNKKILLCFYQTEI